MIAALALLLVAAAPAVRVHRSAIVIGSQRTVRGSQAILRYADDDAARFYEILEPQVNDLQLLTVLDEESQQLYPHAAAIARPATRAELCRRWRGRSKKARRRRSADIARSSTSSTPATAASTAVRDK